MCLDDYYGSTSETFRFYRIPKALFTEDCYRQISLAAKNLYGLMLDRMGLSAKNGWMDEDGKVYIYFTQKDVQEYLQCSHNKATAFFRELEAAGLIERRRQGLGRPAKIYVKNFSGCVNAKSESDSVDHVKADAQNKVVQAAQNVPSTPHETGSPDCTREGVNKTERKETEQSDPERSSPSSPPKRRKQSRRWKKRMDEMDWVQEKIRENIEYNILTADKPEDQGIIDGYIGLMADICCSTRETVRVCGDDLPVQAVRRRFLGLEREHILYVLDCLKNTTAKIGNIKAYTLAALYNAPVTMEQYYDALVSRDMAAD